MDSERGASFPFGATRKDNDVNFAIYGKNIEEVAIQFF